MFVCFMIEVSKNTYSHGYLNRLWNANMNVLLFFRTYMEKKRRFFENHKKMQIHNLAIVCSYRLKVVIKIFYEDKIIHSCKIKYTETNAFANLLISSTLKFT